jgi:hypothetical protein
VDSDRSCVEPLLARVAGRLLASHRPDPAQPGRCAHPRCRRPYPCATVAVATEAATQAAAGRAQLAASGDHP